MSTRLGGAAAGRDRLRDDSTDTTETGAADESTPAIACQLIVLHSPDPAVAGRRFPIGRRLRLGRASASGRNELVDVAIADGRVSKSHATLVARSEGSGFELSDEGSKNGTFVNGVRTAGGRIATPAALRVGDTVCVIEPMWTGPAPPVAPELVGDAYAFRLALAKLATATGSLLPVLLLGETGTGKELFAQHLHASWRERLGRPGRLVVIDCTTIPHELFEATLFGHVRGAFTGASGDAAGFLSEAGGGTLFLDEIGDLPPAMQGKLLRVLETHEYTAVGSTAVRRADVRVIAATNADLARDVAAGHFRSDLYARLAGLTLRLPSLRERRSDIPLLARHYLGTTPAREIAWSASFVEALVVHRWPMNVRELRSAMHRIGLEARERRVLDATDLGGVIDPHASGELVPDDGADEQKGPPRAELASLLRKFKGNVTALASFYGKDRRQIYRWLERRELDPADFKV